MRLIAYMLFSLILFLALEPGMRVMYIGEDKAECCSVSCNPFTKEKTLPENQPGEENSCNQTGCNPFSICKSCSDYTLEFALILSTPVSLHKERYTLLSENIPSKTAVDFWQPPKKG